MANDPLKEAQHALDSGEDCIFHRQHYEHLISELLDIIRAQRHAPARRWNVEEDDSSGDLLVCKGEHRKQDNCIYERYRLVLPLPLPVGSPANPNACDEHAHPKE